jgi:hypothetical protein
MPVMSMQTDLQQRNIIIQGMLPAMASLIISTNGPCQLCDRTAD